jgi:hypothetical protein
MIVEVSKILFSLIYRSNAFIGNCLFNNLSRISINNQNNNLIISAWVTRGGTL